MARIGRYVVPDLPHHVTQRGNRRERVFFGDDDYALYRDLLGEACLRLAAGGHREICMCYRNTVPTGPVAAYATSFTLALTCEAKRAQARQVPERAP